MMEKSECLGALRRRMADRYLKNSYECITNINLILVKVESAKHQQSNTSLVPGFAEHTSGTDNIDSQVGAQEKYEALWPS